MSIIELFQHPAVTHVISFVIGILGSYIVWWYINHKWIPSLDFGSEICKYSVGDKQALYVCAFANIGKRDILDVEVVTRVGFRKYDKHGSWIYYSLRTNASKVPIIEPGRRALIRIMDEREGPSYIDPPPPSLRDMLAACKTLDCVFSLGPEVVVRIHVFGYDSFSGVRRHYLSPEYVKKDIRSGKLKGLVVVGD